MFRFEEIDDVCIRYDGTETRVSVDRYCEGNGLSLDELETLILILEKAREERAGRES